MTDTLLTAEEVDEQIALAISLTIDETEASARTAWPLMFQLFDSVRDAWAERDMAIDSARKHLKRKEAAEAERDRLKNALEKIKHWTDPDLERLGPDLLERTLNDCARAALNAQDQPDG